MGDRRRKTAIEDDTKTKYTTPAQRSGIVHIPTHSRICVGVHVFLSRLAIVHRVQVVVVRIEGGWGSHVLPLVGVRRRGGDCAGVSLGLRGSKKGGVRDVSVETKV